MPVPTYILTGFLDAGKTTLIAKALEQKDSRALSILVLSFEHGEAELSSCESNVTLASYSARRVQAEPEQISREIGECSPLNRAFFGNLDRMERQPSFFAAAIHIAAELAERPHSNRKSTAYSKRSESAAAARRHGRPSCRAACHKRAYHSPKRAVHWRNDLPQAPDPPV